MEFWSPGYRDVDIPQAELDLSHMYLIFTVE